MTSPEPSAAAAPAPAGITIGARSLWRDGLDRLAAHRAAVASFGVLCLIVLACLVGPNLTGHGYDEVYPDYVRLPPSTASQPTAEHARSALERIAQRMRAKVESVTPTTDGLRLILRGERPLDERLLALFPRSDLFASPRVLARGPYSIWIDLDVPLRRQTFLLGTDSNGRDLMTRTLIAGRVSLAIGLLATLVALVIGVGYGTLSGYLGGRVDQLMMRIVDVMYALPFIFFVILLIVLFGRNFILVFVAVGAIEWLDMARIARGETLSIRNREYVLAAEALGVGTPGIIARHLIPNLAGPVIVYMTLLVPKVILLESFLSFLGLGVQEPMTSWGGLIADGARNIESAPWLILVPAAVLVAALFALNFIGDGLRDALDPRER